MFKLLIDTSVWLDIPKDFSSKVVLDVLEEMIKKGEVALIVPRVVIDEFQRHRQRIVKECSQSLSAAVRRAREIVISLGDPKKRDTTADEMSDISQRIQDLGEKAIESLGRIDGLLANAQVIEVTDAIKLKAAQRALDGKAPFHRNHNSIGDAIIIETYAECLQEKGCRFALVSHNTKDFSLPQGDIAKPHPDLEPLFSKVKSLYFARLSDALRKIAPHYEEELFWYTEMDFVPRSTSEIAEAEQEFEEKVWFNRHMLRRQAVESGRTKIVEDEEWKLSETNTIKRSIWEGALKSGERIRQKYGDENLFLETFEWGMLNGKLSALRWVMGDDWDQLYT